MTVTHEKFISTVMTMPGKVKPIGVGRFGARKISFDNGIDATLKPKIFTTAKFRGIRENTQYLREAAAYMMDWKILHFNVIPPTTLTMYSDEPASVQSWVTGVYAKEIVPAPFDHKSDRWRTRLALFAAKVNTEELRKVILFDLIVNNTDRHAKNCLFDTFSNKVWGIDNGLTFGKHYYKYFNVFHREMFRKNLTLEKQERDLLESITRDQLTVTLQRYLTKRDIEETYYRIQWILGQENLGFTHISQGHDDKNSFPSYAEYFETREKKPNKALTLVASMGSYASI